MAWEAEADGFLGVAVGLLVLGTAALVYFSGPARPVTRRLAVVLSLEGIGIATGFGASMLAADIQTGYAVEAISTLAFGAIPFCYLLLMGTLDTPLARPFRSSVAQRALVVAAIAGAVVCFWKMDVLLADFGPSASGGWRGAGIAAAYVWPLVNGVVTFYTLFVAISAWRRLPVGSAARTRAGWFAAAFGVRDASWTFGLLVAPLFGEPTATGLLALIVYASTPVYTLLLAYGILKAHVLDIELRIRWTVRQGTVAAAMIAVFFIVSESVAAFLQGSIGTYLGIAAAGLLVFAMSPLHRLAERLSDRALPASASPDYLAFRKLEVYRAALESAHESGGVGEKDRQMLSRLRAKLGIQPADADALERDLQGATA